jgi:hypothetical protein
MPNRLVGPAAVVAVALSAAMLVSCSASTSGLGATAAPSNSMPPAATPTANVFAGATRLIGGTHRAFQTEAGVTYYTANFEPAFTIRPGADWWMANNITTLASFERGPNEPKPPSDYVVQLVRPTKVVPPGNSSLAPAPPDLIAWLRARPDLTLSEVASVTVGGIPGTMVDGTLRSDAALNPEGIVNLICGELSECGYEGGQLIAAGPNVHLEFIQLDVRGAQVIIGLSDPAANTAADRAVLEGFLSSLAFPSQ